MFIHVFVHISIYTFQIDSPFSTLFFWLVLALVAVALIIIFFFKGNP
jgi:hypothetical protein